MPAISVVIPVYNAEAFLSELIQRLRLSLQSITEDYEILLVEDCGGDRSWELIQQASASDPRIKGIQFTRNYGQHNAIMCGFARSNGQLVVTLDDDLQNPPEEIPKLMAKIQEGYDVVYGVPSTKKHNALRNTGSAVVRTLYRKVFKLPIDPTSFRILRRHILDGICGYNKNFTYIDGLIAWHTTSIGEVEVQHDPRRTGSSGYSFRKLFALGMNMLTNFSIVPLQAASALGLLFSVVGFVLAVSYLLKYLIWGIPVPGYTSVIIGITLFSGVQMLSLGLIGEYLGRIHLNINTKPQYFVRKSVGFAPEGKAADF